ncbi:MAG: dTDP-4-dehydrorhamnose reductase [Deltaproteobacteria bacterium]|nr:dTDP-4-dehydrorhamnose reductase [Deltaproteobacteria bacterium]
MKILLTGAKGQLGQALQRTLTAHAVTAYDHAQLDITKLTNVRDAIYAMYPDVVINAAAYNNVDGAESDPLSSYRGNALGPRNLAVATATAGIPLLHVSSDYVFDGASTRPYHEFDRPHPLSAYAASKLAGEDAVRELNPKHYLVRTAWLYSAVGKNFAKTICALAQQQSEVRVVKDQIGSPTYVPHLATAIATLISTQAFGTYHFANQGAASWYDLTCALYRQRGITTPVQAVTTPEFPRSAKRPAYSALMTIQDPTILLPTWEEGVVAFAKAISEGKGTV